MWLTSVPYSCKLNLLVARKGFNLQIFLFHINRGIKFHCSVGTELCMKFKTTLKVLHINPHCCNHMEIYSERVKIKICNYKVQINMHVLIFERQNCIFLVFCLF